VQPAGSGPRIVNVTQCMHGGAWPNPRPFIQPGLAVNTQRRLRTRLRVQIHHGDTQSIMASLFAETEVKLKA